MGVKKNKVYYCRGSSLGLSKGHAVIIKKKLSHKKYEVLTITSLEDYVDDKWRFRFPALNKAKDGKIIPIPINELNSEHYSGVSMESIIVNKKDIVKNTRNLKYPKKYKKILK